jgi:preprotein translocase subunit YajC
MIDQAYAQTTTATSQQPVAPMAGFSSIVPFFLAIAVLYYFLIINPQNKERKKREEMLNSIQRGDRVLTRGGIFGTVAEVKEQILVLKINENSKIEIDRSYVETVQKPS